LFFAVKLGYFPDMELILVFVLGLGVGVAVTFFLTKAYQLQSVAEKVEARLQEFLPKITQTAGEQTALLAGQKLEAASKNLKDDFELRQDAIAKLIERLQLELKNANEKLEKAERERFGSYRSLEQQILEQSRRTQDLINTTDNLRKVLGNKQGRGFFGEQIAEEILKMSGFTLNIDYTKQESLTTGSKPDFTVILPNKMRINVDAKFPYENYVRYVEATEEEQRRSYMQQFRADTREKIAQVTTRDYINPNEMTVDFVVLFIPNENIFSFIYNNFQNEWKEGIAKKVVFVGPFGFSALLRMVRQSYDQFLIQNNLRNIIAAILAVKKQFAEYSAEFAKIGDNIATLQKTYDRVSITRTRMLERALEKMEATQLEETDTIKKLQKSESEEVTLV
jgi:DNA recombination protein RmuC